MSRTAVLALSLLSILPLTAVAMPKVAAPSDVVHCRDLGTVHASSGHGKHHKSWKSIAKHRALVKAKKLGATHVVWHDIHYTGAFNGIAEGKAYACNLQSH